MLLSRGAVLGLREVHPSAIIAQVSAVRHPKLWGEMGAEEDVRPQFSHL